MATADHDKDIAPPYSFATHLLGAFSVVKAKVREDKFIFITQQNHLVT